MTAARKGTESGLQAAWLSYRPLPTKRRGRWRIGAPYSGDFTLRRYGFTVSQPSGNSSLAASLSTAGTMMTSSPSCQLAGVATFDFAVSWHDLSTRSNSSKFRPELIG